MDHRKQPIGPMVDDSQGTEDSAPGDRSGSPGLPDARDEWRQWVHTVQVSLGLDSGTQLKTAACKFGESCEAVRHSCEQILLAAISPERPPQSWEDLERMVLRWESGFWIGFIRLICGQIQERRHQSFPLATTRSSHVQTPSHLEQSHVARPEPHPDDWATTVVARFESLLRETPRIEKHDRTYPSSDYASLLEAIIIAYFSEDAFGRRAWAVDVHRSLLRWLPTELCQPFFEGDERSTLVFRGMLKVCAQRHYQGEELAQQFVDLEVGIGEVNPSFGSGPAFG